MRPTPVTRGTDPQDFSLFVPIWFGDIHTLKGFQKDAVTLRAKPVSVFLQEEHLLILLLREFADEEEARTCHEEIRAAVARAVAGRQASAHVAPLGEIERNCGPIPDGFERGTYEPWPPREPETDGIIWKVRSYVLPERERILLMPTVTARVSREVSPSVLTEWLRENVTPRNWPPSDTEQLALDLVAEANAQRSFKLAFLGLVNALEVLVDSKELTFAQKQHVDRWKLELDEAITQAHAMNDDILADQLREVCRRLGYLNSSIQNGLRELLAEVPALEVLDPFLAPAFERVDPPLSNVVSKIYAVRSELTHQGRVDDKGKITGSQRLIEATLLARYLVYCVLSKAPYVFIFTGESGKSHGYEDRWDDVDGLFHYVGEGQLGPMKMKGGNRAILRHANEGKRLLLFRMLGKGRPYRFEGEFRVVDHYVLSNVPDTKRNPRDAIVFRLQPLDSDPWLDSSEDPSESDPIEQTSSQRVVDVRTKQQLFRRRLLGYERECRLTGVRDLRFVRASHIKPWSKASASERTDGCNGLLLTPCADHLFDQGWISFTDSGLLLCSQFLPGDLSERLGLNLTSGRKCGTAFNSKQRTYLEHHRDEIFEKKHVSA